MDLTRAERARTATPQGHTTLSLYERLKRLLAERARKKKEKKDHGR